MIKEEFLQKIGVVPKYTKVKLFLMSLIFLLTFATNSAIKNKYLNDIIDKDAWIILLIIFLGIWLSIYNVFSSKKITKFSKIFLLLYAILINVIISAEAYFYLSKYEHGLYIIFPIINVINALLLFMFFKYNLITTSSIIDEQANYLEIIIGSSLVLIIFFISQYILNNNWTITFSMCLVYAANLNELIDKIIIKKIPNLSQ